MSPNSGRDPIGWVRWKIDSARISAQGRPLVSSTLDFFRHFAAWIVRAVVPPEKWRRREISQARLVFSDAPPNPSTGKKVLLMSYRAWTTHTAWETTIAQALRHRGAVVEFFYCGGGLPICEIGWPSKTKGRPCRFCGHFVGSMVEAANFPSYTLSDFVSSAEQQRILHRILSASDPIVEAKAIADLDLKELTHQSVLWFLRTSKGPETDLARRAEREFVAGGALVALAARALLDKVNPEVVLMVNGLFFEERIVREIAGEKGIRVVTYEAGAQRGSLFFSEGDSPAPDYDIGDLWRAEGSRENTAEEDKQLTDVLERRRSGEDTLQSYQLKSRALGRKQDRKLFVLFTNVTWDTAVTGKDVAFDSMLEWVTESVEHANRHSSFDLVIRVHPAETRVPGRESAERVIDFVRARFSTLPDTVKIIGPTQSFDSYELIGAADAVMVYASTIGLEAAAMGKPVAVAARRHYGNRGFTFDIGEKHEFESLFADTSWTYPDPRRTQLARRYAYLFFCRALVPFPAVSERRPSEPVFNFVASDELRPGKDVYLDDICTGILEGF